MSTSYPYAAPVVGTDGTITVQTMLDQPTRITKYLSDLSLRGFFSPQVFTTPGGVTGGAVIYDQLTLNDLFPTRDVQTVEPGAEFPIVTSDDQTPQMAMVVKDGGKFFITDEARDRNDGTKIQTEGRKLINALARRTDAKAVKLLSTTVDKFNQNAIGLNWNNVVTAGNNASSASAYPAADFSKIQLMADQQELGVEFDLWLVNPAQKAQFDLVYGAAAPTVLSAYGVTMVASNRVPAGEAYALESGQVGEIRVEKPLSTETWREQATQRTWVQTDVRQVMYITNPYSVVRVRGLAG